MTSIWFRVEDSICYAWILALSLLLIRNIYLEWRYIPQTETKPIVRFINRTSATFLICIIIVSPDYRTMYGIYSSLNLVLNLGYGIASTALYAAVSIYMYYTFEAASVATARDFHSNDLNWIVQALKTAFVFNIIFLFCVTAILMVLAYLFDTALFIGVWQFYLSAVTLFLVLIFIHASRKLRKALTPFLNQQVFVAMDKRLRNVQFALVPVAIALFLGLLIIAFDNLKDERNVRDPDTYNFTYGIFMWFMLAVESIAQYSAWLPPKEKLMEMYPNKVDSPRSKSSQRGSKRFSFSRSSQKRLSAMYSSGHSGSSDSRGSLSATSQRYLIQSFRNSSKDTLPLSRSPSSGAFPLTPQAILHVQPISPDSAIEISAMALPSMSRMVTADSAISCVVESSEHSVTRLSVTVPPSSAEEPRTENGQDDGGVTRVVVAI